MITSTTETETETANTVEGLVDLLNAAGWTDEAAAVIESGCRTQTTVDLEMTQAQAWVIRAVGIARGQGMLPCWIPALECAIWAHTETIEEGQEILPSCYWTLGARGHYEYVSGTGNTEASVSPSGVLRGRTRTAAVRLAGGRVSRLPAPSKGWEAKMDSLVAQYWAVLEAFHDLPDGRGSQEGKNLLREAYAALAEARSIAAAAMDHGAEEWRALPPEWRG